MSVRVIRVLEYEYPDFKSAEADMAKWGVPANGATIRPPGSVNGRAHWSLIRSATTFPATVNDEQLARAHHLGNRWRDQDDNLWLPFLNGSLCQIDESTGQIVRTIDNWAFANETYGPFTMDTTERKVND